MSAKRDLRRRLPRVEADHASDRDLLDELTSCSDGDLDELEPGATVVLDDGSIYQKLSIEEFAKNATGSFDGEQASSTLVLDDGSIYQKLSIEEFARYVEEQSERDRRARRSPDPNKPAKG